MPWRGLVRCSWHHSPVSATFRWFFRSSGFQMVLKKIFNLLWESNIRSFGVLFMSLPGEPNTYHIMNECLLFLTCNSFIVPFCRNTIFWFSGSLIILSYQTWWDIEEKLRLGMSFRIAYVCSFRKIFFKLSKNVLCHVLNIFKNSGMIETAKSISLKVFARKLGD